MPSKSENQNPKKFDGNGEKSFKQRKTFNKSGGDQNRLSRRRDHPIKKGFGPNGQKRQLNGKVFNQGQPVCMYCLGLGIKPSYLAEMEGHVFKDCPEAEENVKNGKMCFNCGEDHPLKNCKKKRSKGMPFATCFVCKQKGHLAITCKKKPNPEQYDKFKIEPREKRPFNKTNADQQADNSGSNKSQKDESRLKCICCFQYGHIMQDCPSAPESMKKNDLCFNCGKNDHTCRNCPLPKQTPYPFAICFVCQGQGHLANECPTRIRTKKGKKDEPEQDDTFQNSSTGADDDNFTESLRGNNNSNNNNNNNNNRSQGNRPNKQGRYFGNKSQGNNRNQGNKSFGQKTAQKPSGQHKKFE